MWVCCVELSAESSVRLDRGSCEQRPLICVVANHHVDVLIEATLSEQLSGLLRNEVAINGRAVRELTPSSVVGNLLYVGAADSLVRQSAKFGERCGVGKVQELPVGVLKLDVRLHWLPSRALRHCLLEGRLALETSVRGDLVHDTASTSRFTENCDAVLVASKQMNVLLYPLKGKTLVIKTNVGSTAFRLERGTGLPSECTEAVVERHVDDVAVRGVARSSNESSRVVVLVATYNSVNRLFYTQEENNLPV